MPPLTSASKNAVTTTETVSSLTFIAIPLSCSCTYSTGDDAYLFHILRIEEREPEAGLPLGGTWIVGIYRWS